MEFELYKFTSEIQTGEDRRTICSWNSSVLPDISSLAQVPLKGTPLSDCTAAVIRVVVVLVVVVAVKYTLYI